jgi:hypothetical protein
MSEEVPVRTLVAYESMYGNTHLIADAIAHGLRAGGHQVDVMSIDEAGPERVGHADLVVVGGPTHVHGMTRARTRDAAREAAADSDGALRLDPAAQGAGVRDWLEALEHVDGTAGAAFDTRIAGPGLLTGRASGGIADRLRRHGFRMVIEPESFLVDRKQTVLLPGERERAMAWGRQLAAAIASPTPRSLIAPRAACAHAPTADRSPVVSTAWHLTVR